MIDARNDEKKEEERNQKMINTLVQGLYEFRDIATAELKKRDSQLVDTQTQLTAANGTITCLTTELLTEFQITNLTD